MKNWISFLCLILLLALGWQTPAHGQTATPWYFSIHGGDVGYSLERCEEALRKVMDLGGQGVRTDVFWFDVEPSPGLWDEAKFEFYAGYVNLSLAYNLDPLVILSGAPGWAVDLYRRDRNAFWISYEAYVEQVLLRMGDRIQNYQIWNEPNHFIDPIDAGDDWQLFARAGALIKNWYPMSTTFCNVFADIFGWEATVTDWILRAGDFIDVIGIDHYPGTWACCSYTDWTPLDRLTTRINAPGDVWYGKQGAVMETGFSSWAYFIADEYDQRDWINRSLPVLRHKINYNNTYRTNRIVLGNFYQLIDVDTDGWGQEAHFGILHSDYSNKLGYQSLKSQILQFQESL